MSLAMILRLDQGGRPIDWLSREEVATAICAERVLWSMGDGLLSIRGGYDRHGRQHVLPLPSIVALAGKHKRLSVQWQPALCNRLLFRRDKHMCLYCGRISPESTLTRDHIIPKCQGGQDVWMNLATACRLCNQRKGARSPEQANMPLLAIPFVPNPFEFLALRNRHILSDQMAFLASGFSEHMKGQ